MDRHIFKAGRGAALLNGLAHRFLCGDFCHAFLPVQLEAQLFHSDFRVSQNARRASHPKIYGPGAIQQETPLQ
jgi:hypothetical protein